MEKVTAAAKKTRYAEAWKKVMQALDPATYSKLKLNRPRRCKLPVTDIQTLMRGGLFERIKKKEVRQWANMWAMPETKKERRRLLLHPPTLNDEWRKIMKFIESLITDCVEHLDIEDHFVPLDMSAAFFQVPIPPELRKYFVVDTEIGPIAITRLPMGVSFAPELLQLILKIASETEKPPTEADTEITAIHIDNMLISSKCPKAVKAATERVKRVLKQWGGSIDVDRAAILGPHRGVFCGAEFDTTNHTFRVKKSTVEKILHPSQVTTVGQHRENISRMLYASRILRIPMADYYAVLKWTRRLYSKIAKGELGAADSLPERWRAAATEYEEWYKRVARNEWTHHPKKTALSEAQKTYLMTDASLEGWGAVLVQPGCEPRVFSGRWKQKHEPKEMTTLEMRALRRALHAAADQLRGVKNLSLVGDNTSMKAVLRKGAAFSYDLNAELKKVIRAMPNDALIFASYIKTSVMPADDPSRDRPLCRTKLKAALDQLQLRRGPRGVPEGRTRDCVSRVRYACATP